MTVPPIKERGTRVNSIETSAQVRSEVKNWWNNDEDQNFNDSLELIASRRRRRRWNDKIEEQAKSVANFDNPAFNIIAPKTNYVLNELAHADKEAHPKSKPPTSQMDLFRDSTNKYSD